MSLPHHRSSYAHAAQEDRSAPRRHIALAATLRPSGTSAFSTTLIDSSLSGLSTRAVTGMHRGTLCRLSVGPSKRLQAEFVRNDGTTVSRAFTQMLNPAVLDSLLQG